jgi:hypothetical protein
VNDAHDRETLRLAREYKSACDAVQVAWAAFLATRAHTPERSVAYPAYNAAGNHARDCHRLLITHISLGVLEVGV